MRAVLQRVLHASVSVGQNTVGTCGAGFLILLGIGAGDTEAEVGFLVKKIAALRVFQDENGKMNRSVADIGGSVLLVSQFTLYADCRHGNRPDFLGAEKPQRAEQLYLHFTATLRQCGISTQTGLFGADMQIDACCDGPVTVLLDTKELMKCK